jgi:hypothetical protein
MEKKQTACSWLIEQIKNGIDWEDGSCYLNWLKDGTIEKAIQLEKQQIVDAVDGHQIQNRNLDGEQYYTTTYGKD